MENNQLTKRVYFKHKSLNAYVLANRSNKFKGNNLIKDLKEIFYWNFINTKNEIGQKNLHFHYKWIFTDRRKDFDNCAWQVKAVQDSLVQTGFLKTDGFGVVTYISHEYELSKNKDDEGVEITIKLRKEG